MRVMFSKELVFLLTRVDVGGVSMRLYSVNHSFPSVRVFVRCHSQNDVIGRLVGSVG